MYRIPDLTQSDLLSPSIDEEFQEEVRREKQIEKNKIEDMKNLSGYGKSITRTKTSESWPKNTDVRSEMAKKIAGERNCVQKGTTIIFGKLLEKLIKLEKEWMEARNSISAIFSNSVEIPKVCELYLSSKTLAYRNGNGKFSKTHADSMNNSSGLDGGKNPGKNNSFSNNQGVSLACTIRLNQVLGVRPPMALKGGQGGFIDEEYDGEDLLF